MPQARPGDTISYVLTVTNARPLGRAGRARQRSHAGRPVVRLEHGRLYDPIPLQSRSPCLRRDAHDHRDLHGGCRCHSGPDRQQRHHFGNHDRPLDGEQYVYFTTAISDITGGNADVRLTKTASTGTVAPGGRSRMCWPRPTLVPRKRATSRFRTPPLRERSSSRSRRVRRILHDARGRHGGHRDDASGPTRPPWVRLVSGLSGSSCVSRPMPSTARAF